jgi:hypothetical protein
MDIPLHTTARETTLIGYDKIYDNDKLYDKIISFTVLHILQIQMF